MGLSLKDIPALRFPLGVGIDAVREVSLECNARVRALTLSCIGQGCRPKERYRRNINVKPLRSSRNSRAGQDAGDADKLGAVQVGYGLINPPFGDSPTPGK